MWARRLPLHLLTEINVPITCDEFIPGNSEVAVALKVTDGHAWQPENPDDDRWNNRERTLSKVNISIMFIHIHQIKKLYINISMEILEDLFMKQCLLISLSYKFSFVFFNASKAVL